MLLNGHRLVNSATISADGTNFVDINTIPIPLIERIEILKAGASAIYGSDAVAGVVNIITRKDFEGVEAQIGGQTTDKLDQEEWDMSLIGGARGEHTQLTGMVSYFKREPLAAADRDFTKNGRNVSLLGQPSAFSREAMGMHISPFTDPRCGEDPLSEPRYEMGFLLEFCTFDFNPFFQLMMEEERINTYGTINHDVSNHTRVFAEALYASARSNRTVSPSFPLVQPGDDNQKADYQSEYGSADEDIGKFHAAKALGRTLANKCRIFGRICGAHINCPPVWAQA